jgi:hemoglobin
VTNVPDLPVTEPQIAELVRRFYELALADAELRPIFEAAIDDWEEHHRIVADFWSRLLLDTDRYRGGVYPRHARLPIRPEHFDRWLDYFRPAAQETLPSWAAARVIARAEHMTESFKMGMFTFDAPLKPTFGKPAV